MTDTPNPAAGDSVVIERTFDAPIDLVWKMFAEAEHFASWYGPQGATIPVAEMQVSVGGARKICMEMQTPNGPMQMWFVGEYREITPTTRLVYTEATADADGNATSPETEVVVELSETDGGTHLVLTHVGVPADSPGAMGWQMAIDKLAEALAG